MSCEIMYDDHGNLIGFRCGREPEPKDHVCDKLGPMKEIDTGMGEVFYHTCSICGRADFSPWDI